MLANDAYGEHSIFVAVGSHPLGAGRWGHQDMAGSVSEWVLDWFDSGWYSGEGAICVNCANVTPGYGSNSARWLLQQRQKLLARYVTPEWPAISWRPGLRVPLRQKRAVSSNLRPSPTPQSGATKAK